MPQSSLKNLAKKANISIDRAEQLWDKSEEIVKKEYDVNPSSPSFWALRMGVTKKMMGLKEMITFRDFLIVAEQQKFDFEENKQAIIKSINEILSGKIPSNLDNNPFYGIIAGEGKVGMAKNAGLSDQFVSQWKSYFSNKPYISDGGPWSQININDDFEKKSGDERTYNFYVTVEKTPETITNFFKNFYKLASYLKPISDKHQSPIKYKTHRHLDWFIGHNDSFKVYYYDATLKNEVVNAVKKFMSDNRINSADRTHEHGVDVKGYEGGSYGQILSKKIMQSLIDIISKHGNKYTSEQYYNWIVQNFSKLIKTFTPDLRNV